MTSKLLNKMKRIFGYVAAVAFAVLFASCGEQSPYPGFKKTESLGYRKLKNHLCHTYMSFILSELTDEEIDNYLVR